MSATPVASKAAGPVFFRDAAAFRQWLATHGGSANELLVGFYKAGSGKANMTWSESVDEAICVGWIDGVTKRIDDESYQIRFTPRKPGSIWSTVNIAKVEVLVAAGRMQAAGLAAFERRTAAKSSVYAYERASPAELTPAEVRLFKASKPAWRYFQDVAPSYRRVMLHWVVSAKQTETRARRLQSFIEACAEGRKILR